ncbi:MAG TPA: protein-disulfide reductase DsbD family protein, partial [Mariniflexile sp.]|nr:protein-disulfide reductase DsbD family protein [Mariniflexile sp.]
MKKTILLLAYFGILFGHAQVYNPVKWTTSVEKLSESEYALVSKATIETGWHLYSQNVPEDGPIPTAFTYDDSEGGFKILGNTSEEKGKTVDDPVFGMKIKYFEKSATFKQKVEVKENTSTIKAFVEFMVCDDARCLPPTEVELVFNIPKTEKTTVNNGESLQNSGSPNTEKNVGNEASSGSKAENLGGSSTSKNTKKGLWTIFFIAFLSGFAALLTPCVFPMIPMTVSFFTKQSKTKALGIRNAIIYGLSIIVIYVLLGTAVTGVFGADALNALATNVWFNIIFFLILIVFAVSFLGAFEIMLPNSWANKVDSQANRGGLIGIFFMALALAIVSFSCTGPIVGTLLVEA